MKIDDKGLSGAEGFFVIFIALLLIITVIFGVMINRIGPENQPYFEIQDVYYRDNGNNTMTAYVYLSNMGNPPGEARIEWTVIRDGDRLIDSGDMDVTIDGRTTDTVSFEFLVQPGYSNRLNIDVYHDGEIATYYTKLVSE